MDHIIHNVPNPKALKVYIRHNKWNFPANENAEKYICQTLEQVFEKNSELISETNVKIDSDKNRVVGTIYLIQGVSQEQTETLHGRFWKLCKRMHKRYNNQSNTVETLYHEDRLAGNF